MFLNMPFLVKEASSETPTPLLISCFLFAYAPISLSHFCKWLADVTPTDRQLIAPETGCYLPPLPLPLPCVFISCPRSATPRRRVLKPKSPSATQTLASRRRGVGKKNAPAQFLWLRCDPIRASGFVISQRVPDRTASRSACSSVTTCRRRCLFSCGCVVFTVVF